MVEAGRHPMLREEDTPCFARRPFRDNLPRVTLDTARYRAVCDRWCVTDTLRDIARCVTDTTQHHAAMCDGHTALYRAVCDGHIATLRRADTPCFARRTPCASQGGHSVINLRVSPRGRGGQTPRASRGGHPVLREEDILLSSYTCNFGHREISRGV